MTVWHNDSQEANAWHLIVPIGHLTRISISKEPIRDVFQEAWTFNTMNMFWIF